MNATIVGEVIAASVLLVVVAWMAILHLQQRGACT